ncbi:MAG TPA: pallilysin-related adhesin [Treponemataceae bacterium]|nr:pallilysin-related adhesin [Treponemataceae bacterium]
MKQKLSIALFIIAGLALLVVYFTNEYIQSNKKEISRAQLIIPQTRGENSNQETARISPISEEANITTLLQLEAGETLLAVVTNDIDADTYEDQIIAVKKFNNPFIYIVLGLYNPLKMAYERVLEYQTEISQTRTFSLSVLDLVGNGQNAIIYTGFTDKNNSFFQALALQKDKGLSQLIELIRLESDGSIFLQQNTEKTSELSYGEPKTPFSILVHSTETNEEDGSFDQVETIYQWDEATGFFEEFSVEKTPGTRLEAKELAKIQDGTVESFSSYLNGLWLYSDSNTTNPHFIFFDWKNKEIIFSSGEIQEIFSWENSTLRRNGIYISTVNSLIANLNRKIDVSLLSLDEIRIRISSDLGMVINTDTSWDGVYKKTDLQNFKLKKNENSEDNRAIRLLESETNWTFMTSSLLSLSNGNYVFTSGANTEEGVYSEKNVQGESFIQFRSFSKNAFFDGFYTVTKNESSLVLQPVKIHINGSFSYSGSAISLEKKKED